MSDGKSNYLQRVVEWGQDIFDIVFQKGVSSENRQRVVERNFQNFPFYILQFVNNICNWNVFV
jgi:hypothetical protein